MVLATNIAETSITIEDFVFVGECSKVKEDRYDPITGVPSLAASWVSEASAQQRKGWAGRVRPGVCFRMYTNVRHDKRFSPYHECEMVRVPLENLLPSVKVLRLAQSADFLVKAIEPPFAESIKTALTS